MIRGGPLKSDGVGDIFNFLKCFACVANFFKYSPLHELIFISTYNCPFKLPPPPHYFSNGPPLGYIIKFITACYLASPLSCVLMLVGFRYQYIIRMHGQEENKVKSWLIVQSIYCHKNTLALFILFYLLKKQIKGHVLLHLFSCYIIM